MSPVSIFISDDLPEPFGPSRAMIWPGWKLNEISLSTWWPKTILRVMKKYGLLAEIRRHRKWQQMGQQLHKYQNLLNRDFHAEAPNRKWVTDISYIQTKQGTLYLSMIRDLYDNSIVAYKTAAQQTVNLVLDTVRQAVRREKKKVAAELQLHSDQGFQYLSLIHISASYGLTDSMGRMHGDAQFAGSSSVPAHVEMMGLIGMGNNPMVGATVACAVAVYEACK